MVIVNSEPNKKNDVVALTKKRLCFRKLSKDWVAVQLALRKYSVEVQKVVVERLLTYFFKLNKNIR